jgi:hypothetical protein
MGTTVPDAVGVPGGTETDAVMDETDMSLGEISVTGIDDAAVVRSPRPSAQDAIAVAVNGSEGDSEAKVGTMSVTAENDTDGDTFEYGDGSAI